MEKTDPSYILQTRTWPHGRFSVSGLALFKYCGKFLMHEERAQDSCALSSSRLKTALAFYRADGCWNLHLRLLPDLAFLAEKAAKYRVEFMKEFNTTTVCEPESHYMVKRTESFKHIKSLVDRNKYFAISRPRQTGKSTTLLELKNVLQPEYSYLIISLAFLSTEAFSSESTMSRLLHSLMLSSMNFDNAGISGTGISKAAIEELEKIKPTDLNSLMTAIQNMCQANGKRIVLAR
jgi:hypothetical protein